MNGLFDQDPVFKHRRRDSKGRFATAERAMRDKALRENSYLRFQVEKYKRLGEKAHEAFAAQQHIIYKQSRVIADLREELAQTKQLIKNVRQRIR